jgi:hypothetical protein
MKNNLSSVTKRDEVMMQGIPKGPWCPFVISSAAESLLINQLGCIISVTGSSQTVRNRSSGQSPWHKEILSRNRE